MDYNEEYREPDPEQDVEQTPPASPATEDEKVARWLSAVEVAPTRDECTRLHDEYTAQLALAEQAEERWKRAVVQRACVRGWTTVADESEQTAKRLRMWHTEFGGVPEDLASVPRQEQKRRQREVEALERRLAADEENRRRLAEERARLEAIEEGMSK